MSADLPAVLQEAHSIVTEQLTRLCDLALTTRQRAETISSDLRHMERQLDESTIQYRAAQERRAANAALLSRRHNELRARCDALAEEHRVTQHALKQLEQLIRQIEMSSGALSGSEGPSSDPWTLALRAQVIHGREEERVRLAREVHDGPAQVLANSLMLLETCYSLAQQGDIARLLSMLDRMRSATKEGMQDVRRFISDLRPGKLEEQGLVAQVAEYIRGYSDAYGTTVQLEAVPLPRLSPEKEIVLYRILQESLQNAHKYARDAAIIVRISCQQTLLRLSIRDDGPGFDVHEVARRAGRSSWGLTSMRERAELIGARLTVTSQPGRGTEVLVVLPLS